MGLPWTWGVTADEVAGSYPCDRLSGEATRALLRAVTIEAPPPAVFRWLCQLRVAPYSYDLVDNLGRRSPRALTPGLEDLEPGQQFMRIFVLLSFTEPEEITLRLVDPGGVRLFGPLVLTYAVRAVDPERSHLVVKMIPTGSGVVDRVRLPLLAWGDLVMMRKQLRTLSALAESAARLP